jgi:predicted 3-demethylubiquinone-9 3-methyltransferase (glyoxalase superfamily)
MQGCRPHLGFAEKGEEAIMFYVSLIPNSRIIDIQRYGEGGPMPAGSLMWAVFELDGREYSAFDGGSTFKFEEGFSLFVTCDTQDEIDRLWNAFSDSGDEGQCGWIKDRWGLSWQVVPSDLTEMMGDPAGGNVAAMMQALMGMKKLDIVALRAAYIGSRVA